MNDALRRSIKASIDQIQPMADLVLVRRLPDEEVTKSGLIIPAMARDQREGVRIGEVLAVGPGDWIRFESFMDCHPKSDINQATGVLTDRMVDGRRVTSDIKARSNMQCRVGDRVAYHRCPDNDVVIGGIECTLLREEQHVLGNIGGTMSPEAEKELKMILLDDQKNERVYMANPYITACILRHFATEHLHYLGMQQAQRKAFEVALELDSKEAEYWAAVAYDPGSLV